MTHTKQLPKPTTAQFARFMTEVARPLLRKTYKSHGTTLAAVLLYLEQARYDFSADRAFQTRPISNAEIASEHGVSIDTAKRWIRQLEAVGLVKRQLRRNIHHKFKNLLNRLGFDLFKSWFQDHLKAAKSVICTPNKKTISDSHITGDKYLEKNKEPLGEPFPSSGSLTYCPKWRAIAEKHLPSGRKRPCMTKTAEAFRENLKKFQIPFSSPKVEARWANWCRRANPA